MIEQGGRTYLPDRKMASCTLTWSAAGSQSSLRAQDFLCVDGPACGAAEARPDFSASAPPVRFGQMGTVTGVVGDSITRGIDNRKVTVWRR